jgi:hypothetical protein
MKKNKPGRPQKQGIDWFPVDVQFDLKIESLIGETGPYTTGVLLSLWQMIYQNEGYYIEFTPMLPGLVGRRTGIPVDEINKIIGVAVEFGIFNKEKFDDFKVLTSKAIQKRYFYAARRKKNININQKYICNGINVVGNYTSSGINADIRTTKNTHSIVQYSTVDNRTEQNSKVKKKKNAPIFSPEAFTFSEKFYEYMAKNGGKLTPSKSDIEKGADTIDKLIRIDKYDLEKEIKPAIFWGLKTPPWAGNIISLANLRSISKNGDKKFNNLFGNWSARNKHEMTKQEQLEVKSFQNAKIATKMVQERYGENE